ncbi:MAG TPA: prolipoprotein diacylglyceryl transferase [Stellaceae bacterium]|nr:prolipoprotein diacylglyceryl transferase [Stellaceae bacterium]
MTIPYPFTSPDAPIALSIPIPEFHAFGWSFGPFALDIRWYALAYITGLVLGWRYCLALARKPPRVARPEDIDDFLVWATLGVVLGGRTGYVLFYRPEYYFAHPHQILEIWHGGMSFHGGLLGVMTALVLFCRKRAIPLLGLSDIIACAAPIGLFFGRIANFINDELWGRVTDVPWAMVFPTGGPLPRHPSQLYEATLEGIVLFSVLFWMQRSRRLREHQGTLTGTFLIGYAVARIIGEFFREPDANLGFLYMGATMGQLLSLPVLIAGLILVWHVWTRAPRP